MISSMSSRLYPGFESHKLGNVFEDASVTAFFGHRGADRDALLEAFPDYAISSLKQTHSDIAVSATTVIRSGDPVEADAQYTDEKRIALCIRTADCVPVLIHDIQSGTIAAIHAGWRGVANGIIVKTGRTLAEKGAKLSSARAWIGPHIGVESFEVGDDVAAQLESAVDAVRGYSSESSSIVSGYDKKHVDLMRIVRAQLSSLGIDRARVMECNVNTVTSDRHESFRRDREKGGRQWSFIALK
jgi:YfiH family protein